MQGTSWACFSICHKSVLMTAFSRSTRGRIVVVSVPSGVLDAMVDQTELVVLRRSLARPQRSSDEIKLYPLHFAIVIPKLGNEASTRGNDDSVKGTTGVIAKHPLVVLELYIPIQSSAKTMSILVREHIGMRCQNHLAWSIVGYKAYFSPEYGQIFDIGDCIIAIRLSTSRCLGV